MKKTQLYEFKSNLKATLTSFISLTMFVLLGFSVFFGFAWVSDALHQSLDQAYEKGNMHDVEATFTYPVDYSAVDLVKEADGVLYVEGSYVCYEHLSFGGTNYLGKFTTLTERIDVPTSYEGTLPTEKNEVAIEKSSSDNLGIKIGDKIKIVRDDADSMRILQNMIDKIPNTLSQDEIDEITKTSVHYLYEEELTVTAIIVSPNYISTNALSYGMSPKDKIQVSGLFFIASDALRDDVVNGYNRLSIKAEALQGVGTYEDSYDAIVTEFVDGLNPLLDEIGNERYLTVKDNSDTFCNSLAVQINNYQTQIDASSQSLVAAEADLEQKRTDYEAAEAQLTDARQTLDEKSAEITAANSELAAASRLLNEQQAKLDSAAQEIATQQARLDSRKAQLQEFRAEYPFLSEEFLMQFPSYVEITQQLADAQAQLDAANAEYADKSAQLEAARVQYNDKVSQFEAAKVQYAEGEAAYAENVQYLKTVRDALYEAEPQIEASRAQIEDAKKSLETAQNSYNDINRTREQIKDYGNIVIARNNNTAYFFIELLSDMFMKLKDSLGVLFIVIGFMICYSVVTRLVSDQKKLIGTKKALGLSTTEILRPFLVYSGVAFIVGGTLGALVGVYVIEPFIVSQIAASYTFDPIMQAYDLKDLAILWGIEFVLIELVTTFGCLRVIKQPAVALLEGHNSYTVKPKQYERRRWFQKLPTLSKTIINNCAHDRRRLFATIVGVSSCVMLIITPITTRNNVLQANSIQFGDYFKFDKFVYYDTDVSTARSEIEEVLKDMDIPYIEACRTYGYISTDKSPEQTASLMVFDDYDTMKSLIDIESSDPSNAYDGNGVWIPYSIVKYYDLNATPKVYLRTLADAKTEIQTSGTINNYTYYINIFMDADTYKESYGNNYEPNIFVIQTTGRDAQEVSDRLHDVEGFVQIQNYYASCKRDADIFTMIANITVWVYTTMAIVMAFFVLLNLFTTFVEEKKKELIVLMINGFSIHQAKKYIYSDTIFLSIIGIIVGILGGIIFGGYSITAFESEYIYLLHDVNVFAVIAGIVFTILLTTFMTALSLTRIKKFNLEDINRAY